MEHALWKGQMLTAADVGASYSSEKEVRKASGHKELQCPDEECTARILKYCHGEIKSPYFAHLEQADCDYERFDRTNTQVMRRIAGKIAEVLESKGVYVQTEIKVLPHHYVHLLVVREDGCELAVELGTKQLSANHVDELMKRYREALLEVSWLVVSDPETKVKERNTFFLKRFALNESANKSLLVVDWKGTMVTEYRMDTFPYIYRDQKMVVPGYEDVFQESAEIEHLTVGEELLTIDGFEEHFAKWKAEKMAMYRRIVERRDKEEKEQLEQEQQVLRWKQYRQEVKRERCNAERSEESGAPVEITQQDTIVYDDQGRRWVLCERCGKVKRDVDMVSYGGPGKVNLGICKECK